MKNKLLLMAIIPLSLVSLSSCKKDYAKEAKKIYEDGSLTKAQKIDRLYELYKESYVGHSEYNKSLSDKAWDQIAAGDYDGAASTTSKFKDDEYCYECIYYIELLQEKMPKPDSVTVTFNSSYLNLTFSGPSYSTNRPDGLDHAYYKGEWNQYADGVRKINSSFDTGKSKNKIYCLQKAENNEDLRVVVCVTPYSSWRFSYYNDKAHYLYSINLGRTRSGSYNMEYIGEHETGIIYFYE